MAEALRKVGGQQAYDLLDWRIDAPIAKIVATWPGNVTAPRAAALGPVGWLKKNFFATIPDTIASRYRPNESARVLTMPR